MKPVDYRNETWEAVRGRVEAVRETVWEAMLRDGGARTTREWARVLGIDLLTVRPRVTELCQLGFVEVAPEGADTGYGIRDMGGSCGEDAGVSQSRRQECLRHAREGKYRAVSEFCARRAFEREQRAAQVCQLELF